jgi:hypothetical protein
MSSNSDNIEERLIPYIEGVLNDGERQEVKEAIQADSKLAREVEELKEVIGDLRGAFASGVRPKSEALSVEEVVEMAAHDGSLETMPGTSEQKSRLFCNDQAMEEYHLLRGLSEDMQQTTLPIAEVPPMPESLLQEIARYKASETPKVLKLAPKLTPKTPKLKSGFLGFMDRIDPKPLMATAAAFVLLSLGFHVYNTPSPSMGGDAQVAYEYSGATATPATTPVSEVAITNGKSVVEPTGVTVFTSEDRDLLKEQAEKLLAEKVRYTVTEDRILVSEKEVYQARAVLWGDDGAVAAAEKTSEEKLRTRPNSKARDDAAQPKKPAAVEAPAPAKEAEGEELTPPPITYSDLSKPKGAGRKEAQNAPKSYSADKNSDASLGLGEGSALKRSPSKDDEPNWASTSESGPAEKQQTPADIETGTTSASVAREGRALKGASKAEREKILRAMALGQAGEEPESAAPAPPARRVQVDNDDVEPTRQKISRSRVAQSPVENRSAPVANVVTADSLLIEENDESGEPIHEGDTVVLENVGGAVASRVGERDVPKKSKAPVYTTSSTQTRAGAGYSPGASADDGVVIESRGDVDLRLAAVRSTQATVARRYDVVLSVESVGDTINVYVRPNKELSKSELDELRRAIRAELGLSAADAIVFR